MVASICFVEGGIEEEKRGIEEEGGRIQKYWLQKEKKKKEGHI